MAEERRVMELYERGLERQREAAAERVAKRAPERHEHLRVLKDRGGLAKADSKERVEKRIERLRRYYGDDDLLEVAGQDRGVALEKIIGTADFLGVRYLDGGVAAARAIGRVNIRDDRGRLTGYGTGSLVSPALLLTNHHVLEDAEAARSSVIEFNYQDGADGNPLLSAVYPLDPDRFFLADQERDFALVAIRAAAAELAPFGFNRLIEAEGKAIIGEFVTIVQHPRGEKKQIALRENKIVDLPTAFLHYSADTEPGSSGSPVFNDQWEIVGLHHASVPTPGAGDPRDFVNEGIRISRICQFIRQAELSAAQRELADQLFTPARVELTAPVAAAPAAAVPAVSPASAVPVAPGAAATLVGTRDGRVTLSVPLEITVNVGSLQPAEPEAISIDPDYTSRGGYDPDFLAQPLPAPVPAAELAEVASAELRYHHFSVVMHRRRRLALLTACNIDGKLAQRPRRESDRWIFDPGLPAEEQTGEEVYRKNDLDRGHLVRRLDPAWGTSAVQAKAANDDTFHFTNSTPQHHAFNAGDTLWAGLEDYVLDNADNEDLAISVFTGPALAEDDDSYRGVRLPRQFWKIVAMVKVSGELSVTGYLLSQATLIDG